MPSFDLPFKAGFPATSIQERSKINATNVIVFRSIVANTMKKEPIRRSWRLVLLWRLATVLLSKKFLKEMKTVLMLTIKSYLQYIHWVILHTKERTIFNSEKNNNNKKKITKRSRKTNFTKFLSFCSNEWKRQVVGSESGDGGILVF